MEYSFNRLSLAAVAAATALSSFAAIPVRWSADAYRVKPLVYDCYHGETLDLAATLTAYGDPLDLAGKTARLYWQTNGMASAWWSTNASVRVDSASGATNVLAAVWSGAYDTGADAVTGFVGVEGENYRASFTLRFKASPGFSPNALPIPPQTIDWAAVDNANVASAPFVVKGSGGLSSNEVAVIAAHEITNSVGTGYLATPSVTNGLASLSSLASLASVKRDLTNNVCAADWFSAWRATLPAAPSGDWEDQPVFDADNSEWRWYYTDWYADSGNSDPKAKSVTFSFTVEGETTTFSAFRYHVTISNDTFTTYAFVTNAVANASGGGVDTNAVREIAASASVTNAGAVAAAAAMTNNLVPWSGGDYPHIRIYTSCFGESDVTGMFYGDGIYFTSSYGSNYLAFPSVGGHDSDIQKGSFDLFSTRRWANDRISSASVTNGGAKAYTDWAVTTNNAALVSTVTNLAPSKARGISLADPVRHCNWYQAVTNGVFFWAVED